jgi:4-amino-4-deoxy-L-arabinose transferase-like glycosyltransferase
VREASVVYKETDMQRGTNIGTASPFIQARTHWQAIVAIISILVIVVLCLYNLTNYPLTWFDEGSHLHVPKTLVRFGVYADYSSEGFRYYGPTVGVGPTVMLPVAASLKLLGVGLWQARLVMAIYLLAAVGVFYLLARQLGGARLAWVALVLLITSRGVALLYTGRQLLGEVPGMFFLVSGLVVWFAKWERAGWQRLIAVGLLLGLAMVTKYQYLLFLLPALGAAWLANLVYYRSAPQRTFVVPGLVAVACFAIWQAVLLFYLGPATVSENLKMLREAVGGAALTFSPRLMESSLSVLLDQAVYLGGLVPVLVYGFFCVLPRQRQGQQWGLVLVLIAVNLGWYVVASVGWWRYAFLGLFFASLFVARFFDDLTDGFRLRSGQDKTLDGRTLALRWAMVAWLVIMIALPLAKTLRELVSPSFNAPAAMATYMNQNVPRDALVETWEPEMGFLTDHRYHFPPASLLSKAVAYASMNGPSPALSYDFVQTQSPTYVLVGAFSAGVDLYPPDVLGGYTLETNIGAYKLYKRK